jgi:hypothetical protein
MVKTDARTFTEPKGNHNDLFVKQERREYLSF